MDRDEGSSKIRSGEVTHRPQKRHANDITGRLQSYVTIAASKRAVDLILRQIPDDIVGQRRDSKPKVRFRGVPSRDQVLSDGSSPYKKQPGGPKYPVHVSMMYKCPNCDETRAARTLFPPKCKIHKVPMDLVQLDVSLRQPVQTSGQSHAR